MPDNKSISQLTTAEQTTSSDLFETAIPNGSLGYLSRKVSLDAIANFIAKALQYSDLQTEAKTLIDAINEAAQSGGGGGASIEEMTQAEYNALTPEQKADGTLRAISDANTSISDIDDVNLSSPVNGDILVYDGTLRKWKNGDASAYKIAYNNAIVGAFTGTTVQTAIDNIGSCLVTTTTTPTKDATIRTKSGTAYGMFLILGFIQMIGPKMIAIQTGSTGIISCIDMLTGQTFSNQNITFSFADNALTIETTGSGTSTFTIIKG
jgi:hypothetical protein